MKNRLLSLLTVFALGGMMSISANVPARVNFDEFVQGISSRAHKTESQWRKTDKVNPLHKMQKVVTESERSIGPTSYWGTLDAPSGQQWMYTCEYTYTQIEEYGTQSISAAYITIYDADFKVYRTLTASFELGEHETSINSVQISPSLTKKFFNINEDYEVMVYIHATTDDYTGHSYTQVYTLSDGSMIAKLEGDSIVQIDTSADDWSEQYTMVFMRESTVITDDDYEYKLYFDVYSRAGWGSGCKLEHSFEVDYSLIAGAGNYALPILVNTKDCDIYYALPRYEKPYFLNDWTEEITPDNHFIIDLYDQDFNLVKTTSIPMELEGEAIFSFPGLGELNGFDDLSFGVYSDSDDPVYVIGMENYITSIDDFTTSIYVYDADGNRIGTLIKDAEDYLRMSDIPGCEEQFCVLYTDDEGAYFKFINVPSGTETATISLAREGSSISTAIDRVARDGHYKYVSSMVNGFVDSDDNVLHKFAWFDSDGNFDHYDAINLGKNVVMAMPYVAAEAFNPYLFNTNDNYEYMFLVKEQISPESTRVKECLRIYSDDSELLLDLGPISETDEYLSSIFLLNPASTQPKLIVTYYGPEGFSIHPYSLPFEKFAKGSGTKDDPYVIQSAGELCNIQQAPSAYYVLSADIDMHKVAWDGNGCSFTGVLEGNGYTISNLYLTGHGMFRSIAEGAEVRNLTIKNVEMETKTNSGVLADVIEGTYSNGTKVTNVHISDVTVHGEKDVNFGAFTSELNLHSELKDCSATNINIDFGSKGTVGGIVGKISTGATIINCVADGTITAEVAGGIAGESVLGDETIQNCHVNADINAEYTAGGIIGYSSRTMIQNCYVEGNVNATGLDRAYSGGIAGEVKSTYDDVSHMIIDNCIVAAKVTANENSKQAIAHRIAGFTSGDELLVDWESTDPSVDWSDPSTYPYLPSITESAFNNNYAVGVDKIDSEIKDDERSTEGKSIEAQDINEDFLAAHGWLLGKDTDNPWKFAPCLLAVYYESFGMSIDKTNVCVSPSEEDGLQTVSITCDRRYAHLIDASIDMPNVAEIVATEITDDGRTLICTLGYKSNGTCHLIAKLDNEEVTCEVESRSTSVVDIISEPSAIKYKNETVECPDTHITIYNVAGMQVADGTGIVNVSKLPAGVYIAVTATDTLKFVK